MNVVLPVAPRCLVALPMRLSAFSFGNRADSFDFVQNRRDIQFIAPEDDIARRWVKPPKHVLVAESVPDNRTSRSNYEVEQVPIFRAFPPPLNPLVKMFVVVANLDRAERGIIADRKAPSVRLS